MPSSKDIYDNLINAILIKNEEDAEMPISNEIQDTQEKPSKLAEEPMVDIGEGNEINEQELVALSITL